MRVQVSVNVFIKTIIVGIVCIAALTGCPRKPKDPHINFMPYEDGYQSKPDFAQLEYKYPLSVQELQLITPEYLAKIPQEEVDQIYARLTAGPIPDGPYRGDLFFPRGSSGDLRAEEIIGGGIKGKMLKFKFKKLQTLGRILWKGKVFYKNEMILRNRIEDTKLLAPLIDGDLSTLKKLEFENEDTWLLFPAKLYCGQSLLDSRRESVIIDYFFSDEIPGYRELPDFLASRRGFKIRDEIRMIRPGFYLGRAYMDRAFVLNFTLYSKEIDRVETPRFVKTGKVTEDCFTGTRYMAAVTP